MAKALVLETPLQLVQPHRTTQHIASLAHQLCAAAKFFRRQMAQPARAFQSAQHATQFRQESVFLQSTKHQGANREQGRIGPVHLHNFLFAHLAAD